MSLVLPFEPLKDRFRRLAESRRVECVAYVRARYELWTAGEVSLDQLCGDVGRALQEYSDATIAVYGGRTSRAADHQQSFLTEEFVKAIGEAATAIRDAITDPAARHAVAQVLQTRVLLAQSRLHESLDPPRAISPRR